MSPLYTERLDSIERCGYALCLSLGTKDEGIDMMLDSSVMIFHFWQKSKSNSDAIYMNPFLAATFNVGIRLYSPAVNECTFNAFCRLPP